MATVPGIPGLPGLSPSNPLGEAQAQPSNANMMMALAEMQNQGRLGQKAASRSTHPARSTGLLSNRPLPTNRTLRKLSPLKMNPTQR